MKLFKRFFCKHNEKVCITNIFGDLINDYNCRSIWKCKKCGKKFKSNKLDYNCKIVNFVMTNKEKADE